MTRSLRIEYEGAVYHVTARGNERKPIFKDGEDHKRLLQIIFQAKEKYDLKIISYVLMPNHYHLLLETPEGNLTKSMKYIQTNYAIYFNRRHKRSGHLFQGRYKAFIVEKESYLLEVSRYIHLNPLRAGMVKRLEDYEWSSYPEYMGKKKSDWIESGMILEQFGGSRDNREKRYREFCYAGKGVRWEGFKEDIYGGFILGSKGFTQKVKARMKKMKISGEVPLRRKLKERKSKDKIMDEVSSYYKRDRETILKKKGESRKMAIYLLRKKTDMGLNDISKMFDGVSYTGVSKIVKRFEEEYRSKPDLAAKLREIEARI